MNQNPDAIRLLHITDPHLHADKTTRMRGVVTWDTFQAVLEYIAAHEEQPAAILATGDLVQDESRAGYELFRTALEPLNVPVLAIPGNHDDPAVMREVLNAEPFQVDGTFRLQNWSLVMLNSYAAGQVAGRLSQSELERLRTELDTNNQRHTLICLHHHPVPMGSRWLDGIGLENAGELLAIADRAPQVRGILWGHVHQASDQQRRNARLISTPSTCSQFLPGSDEFALDTRPPGYRRLDLQPGGTIASEVIWLD